MQSDEFNNNLKELREDKGLSIESVSSTLKLTTEVIKKLENSEFKSLGAYTYIRGYLNHYADLLGVDAQQYIDLIPKSEFEVPLVNTKSNNTNRIKFKRQSKNLFNYAIGTFIVVAVSFSGYYLLKNYAGFKSNTTEIVKSNDLEILPQDQNLENLDKPEEAQENYHYSSLIPIDDISKNATSEDEILIPPQDNDDSEDIIENSVIETNDSLSEMAYNIIIEASETSWVKVEHLDGNKLHNDLLQPGSISLESNQPIHFRIGNEKNVNITINGESIDLSNFSSKDIADFNWPLEG